MICLHKPKRYCFLMLGIVLSMFATTAQAQGEPDTRSANSQLVVSNSLAFWKHEATGYCPAILVTVENYALTEVGNVRLQAQIKDSFGTMTTAHAERQGPIAPGHAVSVLLTGPKNYELNIDPHTWPKLTSTILASIDSGSLSPILEIQKFESEVLSVQQATDRMSHMPASYQHFAPVRLTRQQSTAMHQAQFFRSRSQFDAAEAVLIDALKASTWFEGYYLLASVLNSKGDYPRAKIALENAIAVGSKTYSATYPALIATRLMLAKLQADSNEVSKAKLQYTSIIGGSNSALPEQRYIAAIFLTRLLSKSKEYFEAEQVLKMLIDGTRAQCGPSTEVAAFTVDLAECYAREEKYGLSDVTFENGLSLAEKLWGGESKPIVDILNKYARMLQKKGDDSRAKKLLERSDSIIAHLNSRTSQSQTSMQGAITCIDVLHPQVAKFVEELLQEIKRNWKVPTNLSRQRLVVSFEIDNYGISNMKVITKASNAADEAALTALSNITKTPTLPPQAKSKLKLRLQFESPLPTNLESLLDDGENDIKTPIEVDLERLELANFGKVEVTMTPEARIERLESALLADKDVKQNATLVERLQAVTAAKPLQPASSAVSVQSTRTKKFGPGDDLLWTAYLQKSLEASSRGKKNEAIIALEAALTLCDTGGAVGENTRLQQTLQMMSKLYAENGQSDKAAAALSRLKTAESTNPMRRAQRNSPAIPISDLQQAENLVGENQLKEAEQLYLHILRIKDPFETSPFYNQENLQAVHGLCRLYCTDNHLDRAESVIRNALGPYEMMIQRRSANEQQRQGTALLMADLAFVYSLSSRFVESEALFDKAFEILVQSGTETSDRGLQIRCERASLYQTEKKLEQAESEYESIYSIISRRKDVDIRIKNSVIQGYASVLKARGKKEKAQRIERL